MLQLYSDQLQKVKQGTHMDILSIWEVGDPATGLPIGETKANLASAVQGETHEYTDMYPGMAKTARRRFRGNCGLV